MAQVWQDPVLAQASQVALGKILSALPAASRIAAQSMALSAPPMGLDPLVQAILQILREAVQANRKFNVQYRDVSDSLTLRVLRPLGCFYWGKVWTLAAWCEVRDGFRSFRLDRIVVVIPMDGKDGYSKDERGKRLADFLRSAAPPGIQEKLDGTS